jgi:hypothetical protein
MSPMIVNPYRFAAPGGGAGYGFAPDDIAGLKLWWRADVGLTTSVDGFGNTIVSTFGDQSGNSNHGTWTGARARVITNVTGNLPAVFFDGTAGFLYELPINAFSGITAAQMFMAIKTEEAPVGVGTNVSGLYDFSRESTNSWAGHYPWSDGTIYDTFGSSTRFNFASPGGLTSWHRLCIKAEASGYQMWKNNTSVHSNATSCGSNWISNRPRFGAWTLSGSNYRFKGYLLEIFMYDNVLSSGDRATVDQYLSDRIDGTWYAAENP